MGRAVSAPQGACEMNGSILPYKNAFDVPDPTPWEASRNVAKEAQKHITLSELINRLVMETNEPESAVRFRIQNWVRDRLLPRPRIVAAHGNKNRGTRGEYGDDHIIGYHVVKALRRPDGKPLSVMLPDPDNLFRAVMAYHDLIHRWIRQNLGDQPYSVNETQRLLQRFGPPPMDTWNLSSTQPWRLRLTTEVLGRLMPIARGESWESLRHLMDPWRPVASNAEVNRQELLDDEAIRMIWSKVCFVETGHEVSTYHIEWAQDDAVALLGGQPIWRFSTSSWTTIRVP